MDTSKDKQKKRNEKRSTRMKFIMHPKMHSKFLSYFDRICMGYVEKLLVSIFPFFFLLSHSIGDIRVFFFLHLFSVLSSPLHSPTSSLSSSLPLSFACYSYFVLHHHFVHQFISGFNGSKA